MLPTNFETYIHSGEAEFHQLPPCQDSLNKHCRRANYQAAIWRNSLRNNDVPSPVGNGWSPVSSREIGDRLDEMTPGTNSCNTAYVMYVPEGV